MNSGFVLQEAQDWVTLRVGSNCSQEGVNMNLLRYVHTGAEDTKAQDFFVFCLFDGKNQSPPQHFYISIKELEKGTRPQQMFLQLYPVTAPDVTLHLLLSSVIFRNHLHLCEAREG